MIFQKGPGARLQARPGSKPPEANQSREKVCLSQPRQGQFLDASLKNGKSMQIEFQGAARTVTGSMHVISANGKKFLLDCGLFQGHRDEAKRRNREFPLDPRSVDAIVLSHAHIDHSGNIPGLVKQGFTGPVFCTPATRDLCELMLADSAYIQERDAEYLNKKNRRRGEPPIEALYTPEDAVKAMTYFRTIPYHRETEILPGIVVTFSDAGHILGSASVRVSVREKGRTFLMGFTGDIGPDDLPIVRDPEFMGDVEVLLSESTYGGKRHEAPVDREEHLRDDIMRTVERGGEGHHAGVQRREDTKHCFHPPQAERHEQAPGLPGVCRQPTRSQRHGYFQKTP